MDLHTINKPTLIINELVARNNIKRMAEKARRNNVSFEPHFKTHQSKEVGEWYRDEGVEAITVSSVSMAQYFANNGWAKITIAFPVNVLELAKINELAKKIELTLLVQDVETVNRLVECLGTVSLLIEIDAGYHRSGVEFDSFLELDELIGAIDISKHQFKGFYCHAGNSYAASSTSEVNKIYLQLENAMSTLKEQFKEREPNIAIGDTPCCSVVNEFKGIDSIHPGNFVYYDYTQIQIGSCQQEQIATYLLCPVVAKNTNRNELVIYGGGVHLSKDRLTTEKGLSFGLVGYLNLEAVFTAYPNTYVKSISQEHGIISISDEALSSIHVGDIVAIIPVHSCMTVDCMNEIYTDRGVALSKMTK